MISVLVKDLGLRISQGRLHHQSLLRITASMLGENLFGVGLERRTPIDKDIRANIYLVVFGAELLFHVHVVLTFLEHGLLHYFLSYITLNVHLALKFHIILTFLQHRVLWYFFSNITLHMLFEDGAFLRALSFKTCILRTEKNELSYTFK